MQIAARQEQFRLQALRYAHGMELGAAPPAGLGINGSETELPACHHCDGQ